MVPDQLLLQMLVTWLGPVAQPPASERVEDKFVAKSEAGENAAKERLVQQPNRPPLKVRTASIACMLRCIPMHESLSAVHQERETS